MTLALTAPVSAVSRRDPYVDYASNLAGFATRLMESHEDLATGALDSAAETGSANLVGLIANAAMGAFVIPSLVRRMRHGGPVSNETILLGAVVGGILGWWRPVPTTLVQSAALLMEI